MKIIIHVCVAFFIAFCASCLAYHGFVYISIGIVIIILSHNIYMCAASPPPPNISVASQSMESVTLVWESGATGCSDIVYMVIISNCGNCPSVVNTTSTNITCENLPADTVCNVSVTSVLPCGVYSIPGMISGTR